jgi:cytochrome b
MPQGVSRAPPRLSAAAAGPWDLATRLFHWLLVLLVGFSFTTGKLGGSWLDWHMRSGYAILALLIFRIAWGFVGPPAARFANFLRGPAAGLAHARSLLARQPQRHAGHNPLGGWMVVALIAILLAQAVTGLFTNDESTHEGPLAALVSNATIDRMSILHGLNQWILAGAVVLHVLAIIGYQWILREDLVGRMIRGEPPGAVGPRRAVALAIFGLACAVVYWLVVILPRPG